MEIKLLNTNPSHEHKSNTHKISDCHSLEVLEEYLPLDYYYVNELNEQYPQAISIVVSQRDIEMFHYSCLSVSINLMPSESMSNFKSNDSQSPPPNDVHRKTRFSDFICWRWKSKSHLFTKLDCVHNLFWKANNNSRSRNDRRKKINYFGIYRTNSAVKPIGNGTDAGAVTDGATVDQVSPRKSVENLTDLMMLLQPTQTIDLPIEREDANMLFVAPKYASKCLLGPVNLEDINKKCCVIDLDETLVHSSFKVLLKYDFKINVDIDGRSHEVFILKRPYCDIFLNSVRRLFECVLFTASLAKYADPVTNLLNHEDVFRWRLFRESCIFYKGGFVKDLSMLGRTLDQIVIIDNSPISFLFHPQNAIHITSWFDDFKDTALLDLIPYLQRLSQSSSVTSFLRSDIPPMSATWPVQPTFQFATKSTYLDQFSANLSPFNHNPRNSPISNISPNDLLDFKKFNTTSNTSLKKSFIQNNPFRNIFSKTYSSSIESSSRNSKMYTFPNGRSSKGFQMNLEKPGIVEPTRHSRVKFDYPTTSGNEFNKIIKQNLNSASEIFAPRYRLWKYRHFNFSQNFLRDKYCYDSNGVVRYMIKRNRRHSRY